MERDLEEEMHCCKVCSKTFTNGRSLGGHMRSHLSSDSPFDVPDDDKAGYGPRENPRKSWRLPDSEHAVMSRERKKLRSVADMCDDDCSVYVPESETETETEDGAMILMMLSRDLNSFDRSDAGYGLHQLEKRGRYRCRTCNRVFNSHQALGGHRASHNADRNLGVKKVKRSRRRSKDHECQVCGRAFASGQALGGHKRSHWAAGSENISVWPPFSGF